jgi:hypothetical protein
MAEIQRLRCRVSFQALQFRPEIQMLGRRMVNKYGFLSCKLMHILLPCFIGTFFLGGGVFKMHNLVFFFWVSNRTKCKCSLLDLEVMGIIIGQKRKLVKHSQSI